MTGDVVHRLGVVVSVAAAVACLGSALAARIRERAMRRRLAVLLAADPGSRSSGLPRAWAAGVRGWAAPVGAVVTGYVLVGGVAGCLVGLAAAWGVRRWLRGRKPPAGAGDDAEAARQLPLAADLLAACLAAGAGPREAAEVVGESLGGPVGERLARAGAELRLGSEPAAAWGRLAEIPGARSLAGCLERAACTGAPAAEPVARLAMGLRDDRSRAATAGAQRAAVLITAPVGLCFLPAFLVVGVAPVVIGLASGLLNGN
ncbi:type II secretion system F family protein [Streptomyces sp. A3M-1-3]|uniref:type II secretion system F family protein n=1 Tax=Streptomyces sp. A3M-1-3 TaxID=2962044 RepID=UPI0020B7A11F|nr:type II secretion system F family protein [Streptomyces sp. A3M-1-3]MCP3820278.1 type II secretion system F family protein [Streptomyces sp. A3M-1-3]